MYCYVINKKWVYGIFPSYNANTLAFINFWDTWYVINETHYYV